MARMTELHKNPKSLASWPIAREGTLPVKLNRSVRPACGGVGGVDRKAHAVIVSTGSAQSPFGSSSK